MLVKFRINSSTASSWLIISFVSFLLCGTIVSILFRKPTKLIHELDSYRALIKEKQLEIITEISIKNKLGQYRIKKMMTDNGTSSRWKLIYPRELPADNQLISNIFETLKKIRIKKIYNRGPINLSNFSLNSPPVTITLLDDNGKKEVIDFGLNDAITNSSYAMTSSQDAIYQIESLNFPLTSLDLANFVDSKIFSLRQDQITSIKIYKGSKKSKHLQLQISKKNKYWVGKHGQKLKQDKIEQFIKRIGALKSHFILDKTSAELTKKLDKYLATPLYTMEIKDKTANKFYYTITSVITSLPDIKMEKKRNFIIKASDRRYSYLVDKDFLKLFAEREHRLARIPFKKLFY